MRTTFAALCLLALVLGLPAGAEESRLRKLETADDNRGWEAVGRLNLGRRGFCTGALIGPQLVLTAAHCLFDKRTSERIALDEIEFLAGWRNGRAVAYRGVKHAVLHPDYAFSNAESLDRVEYDVALLELDQPIRLPSITPFTTGVRPEAGEAVGIVSYGQDRAEAPSLQEVCHVIDRDPKLLILSCLVDFGSSGAPVFAIRDGVPRVVSVVSAKAELDGQRVALGMALEAPLAALLAAMEAEGGAFDTTGGRHRQPIRGGAKFVRP